MVDLPDRARELEWAEGVGAIMLQTGQLATRAGLHNFEAGFEVLDRPVLAARQPPRPEDHVRWFFSGTMLVPSPFYTNGAPTPVTTSHVVEPGSDHLQGCATAAVEFLEQVGVRVRVMDLRGDL